MASNATMCARMAPDATWTRLTSSAQAGLDISSNAAYWMIPPTPLPIPSFDPDASDASAAHLLEFLQNLSDQFASDNAQTSEDYREACLHLIKSLNDHLLKRFPPPHEYIWSTLHERTKLTEVTLEFIPRATLHVGDIFHGKDSFAKSLVLRLLDVCHVLDTWLDVPDISDEDGYSTPSTLRRKAVNAIVAVLQCLGNSVKRDNENDGSNPAGWELLRSLTSECIEACTGEYNLCLSVMRHVNVVHSWD